METNTNDNVEIVDNILIYTSYSSPFFGNFKYDKIRNTLDE